MHTWQIANVTLFIFTFVKIFHALGAEQPKVVISFGVDSTVSHVLPWFFGSLERLSYPKTRIAVLLTVFDGSFPLSCEGVTSINDTAAFCEWIHYSTTVYHSVKVIAGVEGETYTERTLRTYDRAIVESRRLWADYLLHLDVRDLIVERLTLKWMVQAAVSMQYTVVSPVTTIPLSHHREDRQFKNEEVTFESLERWLNRRDATDDGTAECLAADATRSVHTPFLIDVHDTAIRGLSFWSTALAQKLKLVPSAQLDTPTRLRAEQSRIASHVAHAVHLALARARNAHSLSIYDLHGCLMIPTASRLRNHTLVYRYDYDAHLSSEVSAEYRHAVELYRLETLRQFKINTFLIDDKLSVLPSRALSAFGSEVPHSIKLDDRFSSASASLISSSIGEACAFEAPAIDTYVINLRRRSDRLRRIDYVLETLRMRYALVDAVDGQAIGVQALQKMGLHTMRGYYDVYSGRRFLTLGEVGCFLSHYNVWRAIVSANVSRALVLEDDAVLARGFAPRLAALLHQLDASEQFADNQFDLIYVGRRRMSSGVRDSELFLDQQRELHVQRPASESEFLEAFFTNDRIVRAGYSHWTVGYILTLRGAEKLLSREPLSRLVAVDEYLPLVAGTHPNADWVKRFVYNSDGDYDALVTMATEPPLVEPMLFTTSENYVTDTESSSVFPSEEESEEVDEGSQVDAEAEAEAEKTDGELPSQQLEVGSDRPTQFATESVSISEQVNLLVDVEYKDEL